MKGSEEQLALAQNIVYLFPFFFCLPEPIHFPATLPLLIALNNSR